MATGDSDLAVAMAIAENSSSSSQDDDFQLSSHAGQLFILNKLTASHPSKRQKKDHLSHKKPPSQKPERVFMAGKENQNPSRCGDGSKISTWSFTNPDLSQVRKPLEARKQNVRNGVSSEYATKKECRKQENKDEALGDSLRKLADKKQKLAGEPVIRLLKDTPEKPFKQSSVTLISSHFLAVDDSCISSSGPSSQEHCCKQADETLTGSHSLAVDDACISLSRPSSHEHHLKHADETLTASPCFAVDDACIISCKPSLHEHNLKQAFVTLTNSHSLEGDDAHISSSRRLSNECYLTGKSLADECLPSASINPESQFCALLCLCVDAASDNDEEKEPKDDTLSDHLNVEECCFKVEEAITSLLTQTRCKNPVGSSNLCLSHTEEKSSTPKVSQKIHADNATIISVSASNKDFLEAQNLSFKAQDEPLSFECEGANIRTTVYNAGVQLSTERDLEQPGSALECPVCGNCITNLSLEQREVHTNACLDSVDTGEDHADAGFANIGNDQDKEALMRIITYESVEEKVQKRVELKARTYGQEIDFDGSSPSPQFKIRPSQVANLYGEWVMPLTKKVQVQYLLRRLD